MNINQLDYSNALYNLMLMSTDGKNEDLASWEAFIRPAQDFSRQSKLWEN